MLDISAVLASLDICMPKREDRFCVFSEDAFKKLTGKNKELYIIPGANHTDLYYKMDVIPFDKIESFFKSNLK